MAERFACGLAGDVPKIVLRSRHRHNHVALKPLNDRERRIAKLEEEVPDLRKMVKVAVGPEPGTP
jgi:hypothetical protein